MCWGLVRGFWPTDVDCRLDPRLGDVRTERLSRQLASKDDGRKILRAFTVSSFSSDKMSGGLGQWGRHLRIGPA